MLPHIAMEDEPSAEAIEAVLPADAPDGHEAWTKVRYNATHKWPLAEFTHGLDKFERVRFQVTTAACGSPEFASRVARACYLQFENGASKDEVTVFRKDIYDKLKELRKGRKTTTTKASPSQSPPDPTSEVSGEPEQISKVESATAAETAPATSSGEQQRSATELDHASVRFDSHNSQMNFQYPRKPGEKRKKFCVSINRFGGNSDEARQLCYRCIDIFNAGGTEEEMHQHRNVTYDQWSAKNQPDAMKKEEDQEEVVKMDTDAVKKEASTATSGKAAKESPPATGIVEEALPEFLPENSRLDADALAVLPPDAPSDHEAWKIILSAWGHDSNGNNLFAWRMNDGGMRHHFQVTVGASSGNVYAAGRIARACYLKFEAGQEKQEVMEFRKECYAKLKEKVGGAKIGASTSEKESSAKRKRDKSGNDGLQDLHNDASTRVNKRRRSSGNKVALAALKKEGRLQDALVIEGRDADKKNSSVNGVYALIPDGFGGLNAYEKFGDRRFLYYWPGKSRWKVSDELGDDSKGFAYLQADDGGAKPPVSADHSQPWHVFDGKGRGYGKDPSVQCRRLGGDSEAAEASSSKVGQEQSSASSSSDSDSDENESAASGGEEVAAVRESEPAPTQATPSNGTHVEPLRPRGMVCAKMLARSALRCKCHFQYVRQCPSRSS